MKLTVNGSERDYEHVGTIADLLVDLHGAAEPAGVAVAVNDAVVPRPQWVNAALSDGDRVEVITAVQGG